MNDYITVNEELLAHAATPSGGYTKTQLAAIGVPWPPPKHWKRAVVGRRISRTAFDALMMVRYLQPSAADRWRHQ